MRVGGLGLQIFYFPFCRGSSSFCIGFYGARDALHGEVRGMYIEVQIKIRHRFCKINKNIHTCN